MKKKIFAALALMMLCAAASAQYTDIKFDTKCAASLVRVDQYDETTVMFFHMTAPEERLRFAVNDNIKVVVNGEYKKCRLVSVANITMSSEDCVTYLKKKGDELNFLLEFEKVPLDGPFDIIENPDKESALTFNFRNVKVNTAKEGPKAVVNDFLGYTDFVKSGLYSSGGDSYMYYDVNGLSVATHLGQDLCGFTKIGVLRIVVTNDSGRDIKFSDADITVTAVKNEKKGYVEIPLWNVATYDSFVRENNANSLNNYSENISPVASSIGRYRRDNVAPDNLSGQLILGSIEYAIRASKRDQVDEYASALEENRRRLWNNYLQSASLADGESYGGFVSFPDKNYKHYVITIRIGGNEYTFHING